jgi:hypothetical protein
VLHRATHVSKVRGRAEHVALRSKDIGCGCLKGWACHNLDALDLRVVRTGQNGFRQGLHGAAGGVVDDEQAGHGERL